MAHPRFRWAAAWLLVFGVEPLFASDAGTEAAGTILPGVPDVPPGRVAPVPADPLRAAIDARTQGDLKRAAWLYEQVLTQKSLSGRTRAAVWLALGEVRLDLGDNNVASAAFGKARAADSAVAPWAAWYQARADHGRGRDSAAASTCAAYRKAWPTGPHADACLVLMGDAYAANGKSGAAVASYREYLTAHPESPREETLNLKMALAVSQTDPASSIPRLQELAVNHLYHSTGASARARLDELAARGFAATLPTTPEFRCREALEQKRCGFDDAAWTGYQKLAAEAQANPSLAAWIDSQQDNFAWGTKQYDVLAASLAADYAAKPDARTAWDRYKALSRGGMWAEAAKQLELGIREHGTTSYFRGQREALARALLLSGRYPEARDAWTAIGKSGGATGREAKWLAAYATFRAAQLPEALTRLDAVIASGAPEATAARYYRIRTLHALERHDEAGVERARILKDEPESWYAVLLNQGFDTLPDPLPAAPTASKWTHRSGRWPGAKATPAPVFKDAGTGAVACVLPIVQKPATFTGTLGVFPRIDWSQARWNGTSEAPALPSTAPALPAVTADGPEAHRPDSYQPGFLFDPAEGDRLLAKLGADHAVEFPWAAAAADLARAGNFDDAAPIVSHIYDDLEARTDGGALYASLGLNVDDWRQIAYFVRDDYHAARFSWGASKLASTPAERKTAIARAFPTAQADALYRHGQAYDVDPLLVLGLMRQESVYRQWALSPVGAIGLMQVMPRTGARVAALMGDPHYSPEILEDPSTNVRYGVWYLSRLLNRFDGVFPLAVASYNGGPHNVSSWLRPWGDSIRTDDFVEQIPYPESRDYVKKVTGYYATYVELYGPKGSAVDVPYHPRGDDSSVINF
jgi:soluble lytic murein transglycosylase-like protein